MNVRDNFLERLENMLECRQINIEERDCIRDGVMRNKPKAVLFTPAYQYPESVGQDSDPYCPECNFVFDFDVHEANYCPRCGQRLLWDKPINDSK